jgi:hypothetical protein
MNFKFGKLAPKANYKTLRLRNYLHSNAPVVPATQTWDYAFQAWPMDANDTVGDCTCAAIAHMVMLWTAYQGKMVRPTTQQVLEVYSAVTGYDPNQTQPDGSNPTDNGANITDILNYWRSTGIAGHKIDGWAQIDHTNIQEVKQAIYLFGGVNPGFQVPQSAMDQNSQGQPWTVVPNDGGIVGGHSVPAFDYSPTGGTVSTWGMKQAFDWNFWLKYMDECYCIISLDWLRQNGVAPNHLNLAQLEADLKALPA